MQQEGFVRYSQVAVAVILTLSALSVAESVFAPLACALFIMALAWPLQSRLQMLMPRVLALAVSIVVLAGVSVGFGALIVGAFSRVGRWIVADAARLQQLYEQMSAWLQGQGVPVSSGWLDNFDVGWILKIAQSVTGRLNNTLSFWLIALVYVVLGLLEVSEFRLKFERMRDRDIASRIVDGFALTSQRLCRYMIVRTVMSIATGLLVWAFARSVGLPLAAEWGFIAFSLNYVPVLGPLIATLLPTVFALTEFGSWQAVAGIFMCLSLIQLVIGNYLEPRATGSTLSISPVLVLFSVFLWTYLWGIFGAFIGVPIMIAFLTFCAGFPSSAWVAEIFGPAVPDRGGGRANQRPS
jgi:AI-2 transport protein TqsA